MITQDNWREFLIMNANADGLKRGSLQNAILVLKFSSQKYGKFWMVGDKIHADHGEWRPEKEPGEMVETDYTALRGWLEYAGLDPNEKTLKQAVEVVAKWKDEN